MTDAEHVVWTRMQAEAGQPLDAIVARKERERRLGDGLFLWGVGSAPSRTIPLLARALSTLPVVFSVMLSKPRDVDASPSRVFAWRRFLDVDGVERDVPKHALVTSRADAASGPKRSHAALFCRSSEPIALRSGTPFDHHAFVNAGPDGAPVGASQTTALLRRITADGPDPVYERSIEAELDGCRWVKLVDPVEVPVDALPRIARGADLSDGAWLELVRGIRHSAPHAVRQESLL